MCLFGVLLNHSIFSHQVLLCLLPVGCWRFPYKDELVVWKIYLYPWKTLTHIPGARFSCTKGHCTPGWTLYYTLQHRPWKQPQDCLLFFLLMVWQRAEPRSSSAAPGHGAVPEQGLSLQPHTCLGCWRTPSSVQTLHLTISLAHSCQPQVLK